MPTDMYEAKKINAERAAAMLRSGDTVIVGAYGSEPFEFLSCIHKAELGDEGIELCCGTLSRPYAFLSDDALAEKVRITSMFFSPELRCLNRRGRADYIPTDLSWAGKCIAARKKPRVCVATVGPMDEEGYFYFSTNLLLEYEMVDISDVIIFEVNRNVPRLNGDSRVHISRISFFYETDNPLQTLPEFVFTDTDRTIAENVAALVKNGDTIQLGVGSLPECMSEALANHRDLGVHTEFFGTALGKLMELGVINNSKKTLNPGKSVFAFSAGTQHLYNFLNGNPDTEIRPVVYVNDSELIARHDNMVSINAALEVDLTGQICSESVGSMHYSGTGGASDFARGAYRSKGGRGIIAIHSTAKDGAISKIKFQLTPGAAVSISRNLADCIVTEYGTATLRGCTLRERAKQLIAIAHPDFRAELTAQARDLLLW